MPYSADYSILLDLFIQLVDSQAGLDNDDGDEWLHDAQTLSIKLFRHLVSMQTLAAGATVEQNNIPVAFFIDHASVKVVARAALETYLVFCYLYGNADRELSKFRHKTWQLGGLVDRQQFHASSAENRNKLLAEEQTIEKLRSEIQSSSQFQRYAQKQGAKLLKGDWKIGNGWADIGVSAGLHKKYFKDIYGYLCGYSHSSYLSALQVGQANSIEKQKSLTQGILGVGVVVMAHYAFCYSEVFNSATAVISKNPDAKLVAEKWRFGPENMAAIYDKK